MYTKSKSSPEVEEIWSLGLATVLRVIAFCCALMSLGAFLVS